MVHHTAVVLTAFSVSASAVQFLSIGDWGDSGAKDIAGYMGSYTPDFVIAIGDNFYSSGVKSVDDPQWKAKYEDTFTAQSLQEVPWYVCAGNHDYYGGTKGISAEMEYSNHSKRWTYPSLYFSKDFVKDGVKITVLSVDTWRLNGGDTYVMWHAPTHTGMIRDIEKLHRDADSGKILNETRDLIKTHFKPVTSDFPGLKETGDSEQLSWIANTLKNSDADWKLVMGHFPIHSCTTGEHGDTKSLISNLQPILEQNGADAYFSGHDHILQHIQLNNVHYIGSGAGAKKHTGVNTKYAGLQGYHEGHYGFMVHEASKTSLTTTFVDDQNSKPYKFTINKGAPGPTPPAPQPTPPTPPPSIKSWECHDNKDAGDCGKDHDLDGKPGKKISDCETACANTDGCVAIVWHKSDEHCHIRTGSCSHDDFTSKLEDDDQHTACWGLH